MTRAMMGGRLCDLRHLRRLSQAEVGRPAGLSKEAVCRIERGERELSFYEMACFAKVLCISLDAFYRTEADGRWDITACLLPYTPPAPEAAA